MEEFKLKKSLKWSFNNFLWDNNKLKYIINLAIKGRFTDIYIIGWKNVLLKKKNIIRLEEDLVHNFNPLISDSEFESFLGAIFKNEDDLTTLTDILWDLNSFDYWIWYTYIFNQKFQDWGTVEISEEIRLRLNFENTVDWIMITIRPLINIWLWFKKLTSLDWAIDLWKKIEPKDQDIEQSIMELTRMNTIPELIKADFSRTSWLILVTWTTWEWKSTLVTSLLQEIINTRSKHVLTLEDPVEFLFSAKTWKVTQIEVWSHISTFAKWIKWSKRQNPDIVYIQEIRDYESAKALMDLLWSWVLVITTLHTWSVSETIDRLVWLMSSDWNESYVRTFISRQLISIINQKLIYIDSKAPDWTERILTKGIQEYLHMNSESRKYIKDNQYYSLESTILESLPPNKSITRTMWNLYILDIISIDQLLRGVTNLDSLQSLIKDQTDKIKSEEDVNFIKTFFWIDDIKKL